MESRIRGVTLLRDVRVKAWPSLLTDVSEVICAREAVGEYVSRAPRLFVLLETADAGSIDLMCSPGDDPKATLSPESPLCFVPAGMPIWSRLNGGGRIKHLDIHFDLQSLPERFPDAIRTAWDTPRLTFRDPRLLSLAHVFAQECDFGQTAHPNYEHSLVTALMAAMDTGEALDGRSGRLTTHQLRRVTRFIEENCARNIRLQEMADLAGLSPSYFSQAFKASTGLPPHRFQLRKRVECAKAMLVEGGISLTDIAVDVGFSDQAHLTRVFQRFTGSTPAAWQREHQA
ncbi:helix-turn-helix domain-containing protein [Chelativorans xinjiangense]|uniref:helix-turn-helix domain-containing protein n=1 Tax=Chelativorans xinjiangense TaxID=2681485 RepID=UPI00135BEDC9|nr:AraC family transcriptional regulator [Chelativorans xinjiangense]